MTNKKETNLYKGSFLQTKNVFPFLKKRKEIQTEISTKYLKIMLHCMFIFISLNVWNYSLNILDKNDHLDHIMIEIDTNDSLILFYGHSKLKLVQLLPRSLWFYHLSKTIISFTEMYIF